MHDYAIESGEKSTPALRAAIDAFVVRWDCYENGSRGGYAEDETLGVP